ncbi:polysaccharide biosynthesis/export family protein [Cognataquiflexum rubidum]|uniref:polysaccharide biosynthesis/export family protein n=1 Tax=Cognataquiflexum rubidum TaxID=2922273 RepID=UPI001F135892|nr:polysaccharide biosynthesis/export family protein [Cognataquiflexum rubidum]MCH6234030.1 polysaccharide biosynthesis/export family protein [Cognataquiflexum rubidum]
MKKTLILFVIVTASSSCAKRNLTYLSDLPENEVNVQTITNLQEPRIQPVDLLGITVSTLNPESNLLFNSGVITSVGSVGGMANTPSQVNDGYRVDSNGDIHFAVLGKVNVGGLTLEEAAEKMTQLLSKEVINPIVNIKLLNFRITVIGEVRNPSTFPIPAERINILEAIGLAGDMTSFGKRENILLIREIDGVRTTARLDINQTSIMSSPYFYLQQNDIVYVEPIKNRKAESTMWRQDLMLIVSVLSLLTLFAIRFD